MTKEWTRVAAAVLVSDRELCEVDVAGGNSVAKRVDSNLEPTCFNSSLDRGSSRIRLHSRSRMLEQLCCLCQPDLDETSLKIRHKDFI